MLMQVKAHAVSLVIKLKNSNDMMKCVEDRPGGCVIVYSGRPIDAVKDALQKRGLKERPLVKLAVLSSEALSLHLTRNTPARRVIDTAVRLAMNNTGTSADVIVHVRQTPTAARGPTGHTLIITSAAAASPGDVSLADIDRVADNAAKALAFLGTESDGSVDTLLAREEYFEKISCATLNKVDIQVKTPEV